MKLFLLHQADKFYLRELARNLGLQLNSVRRELINLEKIGLIKTESTKTEGEQPLVKEALQDKKYYKVNPDFILFEELKALFLKSQLTHERDFTEKLTKIGNVRLLILTGLFVNFDESPVDIFVVGDVDKNKLVKVVKELEEQLLKEVNYVAISKEEFDYRREITDVFLYNILEGKKIVIIDEDEII